MCDFPAPKGSSKAKFFALSINFKVAKFSMIFLMTETQNRIIQWAFDMKNDTFHHYLRCNSSHVLLFFFKKIQNSNFFAVHCSNFDEIV